MKRAQAAMEFLMTYGWALLVVLTGISALAFFGVLNPSRLTPEQCVLGPGFACSDFKLDSATSTLQLSIQNGFGKDFDLFLLHVKNKDDDASDEPCGGKFGYFAGVPALNPFSVPPGQPFFLSSVTPPSLFKDGALLPLLSMITVDGTFTVNGIQSGISCNNPLSCCVAAVSLFTALKIPLPGFPICSLTNNAYCSNSALEKKKKYSFEILITYREAGSSLIHQRLGTLTTVAE